jgi:hypothetical protein
MRHLHHLLCVAALTGLPTFAFAQSVGIGTTTPNAAAALEIQSTTQGVLLPRLSTNEMNAVTNPVPGLTVYNTTEDRFFGYGSQSIPFTQNIGSGNIAGNVGQSFTPTETGALATVSYYIANTLNPGTYTVYVYFGEGGFGVPLATATVTTTTTVGGGQYLTFSFPAPGVRLLANFPVTFYSPTIVGTFSSANPYSGGQLYVNGSPQAGSDLRFQVEQRSFPKWGPLR